MQSLQGGPLGVLRRIVVVVVVVVVHIVVLVLVVLSDHLRRDVVGRSLTSEDAHDGRQIRAGVQTHKGGCHIFTSNIGNSLLGTFQLKLRGHTSSSIPFNASADQMKSSLEALPNIVLVHVQRSAPTKELGFTWTITFESNPGYYPLSTRDVDTLEFVNSLSSTADNGSSATVNISVIRNGNDPLSG